ncbi:hypothetical protein M4R22_09985 [Acidovorax sp. GBBC 3334]|uniref:hypothetical protein n=1 Tax=unclassified Acidovorax TaxID=2684926 RepID=UPI002304A607|nr:MULTISPECIES: hypothetical protein [unclassified Acidovorax]MDA8455095.1 hypothetical protein [Acidovorax sp. GBBC 3334]MDA8523472.1 hypothetical protein [Acidovorax sp. NCPPB 4044]
MDKVIVYVDDAAYAHQILAPLTERARASGTHWVVVACAPRMTHRISKWVSHSARENWRAKWADKLFAQMLPWLRTAGVPITPVLAKGPLADLVTELQAEHGTAQIVDARRPKQEDMAALPAPVVSAAPVTVVRKPSPRRWSLPGTLAGLGAMFMFVAE